MLTYLVENHIPFFEYLQPIEINKLTCNFSYYFPNSIWKDILISNTNIKEIKLYPGVINLIYHQSHITSIDKRIIPGYMQPYQYICLRMCSKIKQDISKNLNIKCYRLEYAPD
jgi:hypothetical protein